jgi:copper chaperone
MQERFDVPDVSCEHCVHAIKSSVEPLAGVAGADVDLTNKAVTVSYEPDSVDRAALVAAIEAAGYPVANA